MCTVKTESGLGYKSSQVRVQAQVQQKWTLVRTRVQVRTQVGYKSADDQIKCRSRLLSVACNRRRLGCHFIASLSNF